MNRRWIRLSTLGLAAFMLCAPAVAQAGPPATLEQQLDATLSKLPHAATSVGACVIDLATHRAVYTKNGDGPLAPASTMKLFAMTAALAELGPDFSFDTVLATDGANLIVIGDGDPGFGDEKIHKARGERITAPFERWAQTLRQRGLTRFAGDVLIDESVFDEQRLHPTWERNDLADWYAAPVGALNFNDNCLDIAVAPSKKRGAAAVVTVQPKNSMAKVINSCVSGGSGSPLLHHAFDSLEYAISGRCAKAQSLGSYSFPDPGLLFADAMRMSLIGHGITVQGSIRRARVRGGDGGVPASLTLLDRHATPLANVLARAGKDSQNLFAECLLKRAGYAWAKRHGRSDPQGSWNLGGDAVHETLQHAGVDPLGLLVADGSGLSRSNACSARQLAGLLAWAQGQSFARVLYDSLATAGVDGSLRKRLKDSDGRIHAKTGTMRGIRALAGYVDSAGGPRFAFAVMFNGYPGPAAPYKSIQDRFCRILADACEDRVSRR